MCIVTTFLMLVLLAPVGIVMADDTTPVRQVVIHDHAFAPTTLAVRANRRTKIQAKNPRALPSTV